MINCTCMVQAGQISAAQETTLRAETSAFVWTPEDVAKVAESHTGRYLIDMLGAKKVAAE